MINYSTLKKQKKAKKNKFKIVVNFMHGDGDRYDDEIIKTDDEDLFNQLLEFYFKVRNFLPNVGYDNLGYYNPITDEDEITKIAIDHFKLTGDDAEYFEISAYFQYDTIYGGREKYLSKIESIKAYVDGDERVLLDMDARKSNFVELPVIGSKVKTDMGHVNGCDDKRTLCGYTIKNRYKIPFNPDGRKTSVYTPLTGIVVDHLMGERSEQFDNNWAIIKLDMKEFGVDEDVYTAIEYSGWLGNIPGNLTYK